MEDFLDKLGVKYVEIAEPIYHYVINSALTKADIIDLPDSALFITKNGVVRIIIPNFHTVTDCSYFSEVYPDLYFSIPYSSSVAGMGEIFLEDEYGFRAT